MIENTRQQENDQLKKSQESPQPQGMKRYFSPQNELKKFEQIGVNKKQLIQGQEKGVQKGIRKASEELGADQNLDNSQLIVQQQQQKQKENSQQHQLVQGKLKQNVFSSQNPKEQVQKEDQESKKKVIRLNSPEDFQRIRVNSPKFRIQSPTSNQLAKMNNQKNKQNGFQQQQDQAQVAQKEDLQQPKQQQQNANPNQNQNQNQNQNNNNQIQNNSNQNQNQSQNQNQGGNQQEKQIQQSEKQRVMSPGAKLPHLQHQPKLTEKPPLSKIQQQGNEQGVKQKEQTPGNSSQNNKKILELKEKNFSNYFVEEISNKMKKHDSANQFDKPDKEQIGLGLGPKSDSANKLKKNENIRVSSPKQIVKQGAQQLNGVVSQSQQLQQTPSQGLNGPSNQNNQNNLRMSHDRVPSAQGGTRANNNFQHPRVNSPDKNDYFLGIRQRPNQNKIPSTNNNPANQNNQPQTNNGAQDPNTSSINSNNSNNQNASINKETTQQKKYVIKKQRNSRGEILENLKSEESEIVSKTEPEINLLFNKNSENNQQNNKQIFSNSGPQKTDQLTPVMKRFESNGDLYKNEAQQPLKNYVKSQNSQEMNKNSNPNNQNENPSNSNKESNPKQPIKIKDQTEFLKMLMKNEEKESKVERKIIVKDVFGQLDKNNNKNEKPKPNSYGNINIMNSNMLQWNASAIKKQNDDETKNSINSSKQSTQQQTFKLKRNASDEDMEKMINELKELVGVGDFKQNQPTQTMEKFFSEEQVSQIEEREDLSEEISNISQSDFYPHQDMDQLLGESENRFESMNNQNENLHQNQIFNVKNQLENQIGSQPFQIAYQLAQNVLNKNNQELMSKYKEIFGQMDNEQVKIIMTQLLNLVVTEQKIQSK